MLGDVGKRGRDLDRDHGQCDLGTVQTVKAEQSRRS